MSREPTLIAVAVVEHEGRYLIGQRATGLPLGGLWEFPGGKVEPGETPPQAAARECLEETGLAISVGEPYLEVTHQYAHDHVRLCFFRASVENPDAEPRLPFRWVAAGELRDYQFPEANAALIEHLQTHGTC